MGHISFTDGDRVVKTPGRIIKITKCLAPVGITEKRRCAPLTYLALKQYFPRQSPAATDILEWGS